MAFTYRAASFACSLVMVSSAGVLSCLVEDSPGGTVFYAVTLIPSGELLLRRLRDRHRPRRQTAQTGPMPVGRKIRTCEQAQHYS